MFCYQYEQTMRSDTLDGSATDKGMCGKTSDTSDLQDVLIYQIKGISQYAQLARSVGIVD